MQGPDRRDEKRTPAGNPGSCIVPARPPFSTFEKRSATAPMAIPSRSTSAGSYCQWRLAEVISCSGISAKASVVSELNCIERTSPDKNSVSTIIHTGVVGSSRAVRKSEQGYGQPVLRSARCETETADDPHGSRLHRRVADHRRQEQQSRLERTEPEPRPGTSAEPGTGTADHHPRNRTGVDRDPVAFVLHHRIVDQRIVDPFLE